MKWLLIFLAGLLLTVGAALVAYNDPGYILIGYGKWTVETTLTLFIVAVLGGFLALYYAIRIIKNTWQFPSRLREWNRQRHSSRATKILSKGLIALAEGQWHVAERNLVRYASDSAMPLVNYLAAARAAQEQDASDRRDNYLQLAHESTPDSDIAVGLTQAELQLTHKQTEQALATLMHLHNVAPKHTHVLKLLMDLYISLEDWRSLIDMFPELRKRKILVGEKYIELELKAYTQRLIQSGNETDTLVVHRVWESIPHRLKAGKDVLYSYLRILLARGDNDHAEEVLRNVMKRYWSEYLVYLYGTLETRDYKTQLNWAERWLKKYPDSPMLLLTLGRLSIRNDLWGKARSYLETSLALQEHPETYHELAVLLEKTDDAEKARDYYRKGLNLVTTGQFYKRRTNRSLEPLLLDQSS
ncbi:MAG: heme biosynthesis protein HemY [Gammaproteobacteria bacterium]|nr:heme biosynthesis protein HemY [Gammaproteobacteria bacterium]MDH5593556.1 heme biosynthesis protein HemY [Gammaproteobacteria bacterium]